MYRHGLKHISLVPLMCTYILLILIIGTTFSLAFENSVTEASVRNTTVEGYYTYQYLDLNATDDDINEYGTSDGGKNEGNDVAGSVDDDDDIVSKFLSLVEEYKKNKKNCTKGTSYNLGAGVVRQYGLNRFKKQADVALSRANLLTRLWKNDPSGLMDSEFLLYSSVRNMVEGDPDMFAAGNCYNVNEYKDYYLFCPYAYIMPDGRINVKDLSVEYDYYTNDWFYNCRFQSLDYRYAKASPYEMVDYTDSDWYLTNIRALK
ncbi:Hypothetical predicted protein [Octopus vulgaris]|uniref:Uncharacterized protein n=1 Tax=Octopus vulgaris TaxID=6645 RepID=A0AA36B5K2_OCTVU|nr:Hypothetical predicted protein [Octopus vulgaris]